MKSLDTNVIIRFLVNDDKKQGDAVKKLFIHAESNGKTFMITTAVLLETIYVLDSVYNYNRNEIINAINAMISLPILVFENTDSAQQLVEKGESDKTELEDLLIGLISRENGCETTLTFDKKAAKSDLFELIH